MPNLRLIMTALVAAFLVFGITSTYGFAANNGDTYIERAKVRLKVGSHSGVGPNGEPCTVVVTLEKLDKLNRRYTVQISPAFNSYKTSGPTIAVFSSTDGRVLFDAAAVRAVSNAGEDYTVLGIEKSKLGTTVSGYVKRGDSLSQGACTF